jgi:protein involved in polysaccharide export with SLBB domain
MVGQPLLADIGRRPIRSSEHWKGAHMFKTAITLAITLCTLALSPATQPQAKLRVGDLVRVSVLDLIEAGKRVEFDRRVDRDGNISMPIVGAFSVTDVAFDKVPERVNATYHDLQIITDANAQVTFLEAAKDAQVKPDPAVPGDTLLIRIWDVEGANNETQLTAVVSEKGTIKMPRVGEVEVKGMTDSQIEDAIAKLYRDQHLLAHPKLSVLRTKSGEAAKR